MNKTLFPIRIVFVVLCALGGWLLCYAVQEWDNYRMLATAIGLLIGILVVLVDVLLKGFSLRGMSAVTVGLAVGSLIAYLLSTSPLFQYGDPEIVHLARLAVFIIATYLCTVIALRGKDEFNLIIPYVRFVPQEVDVPLVVVDTSALIDGRIVRLCESGFLSSVLVIPRFVLHELQSVADSNDMKTQARGRRGLETLNSLRKIKNLELRITDSEVSRPGDVDAKLVFLAQSMRAKLLTTDYNLAKMAEFHGVHWLNLSALSRALRPEMVLGEVFEVELVKSGKEPGQAVGYLEDGSMVVVANGHEHIGKRVDAEIISILPSAGGKMVFAKLLGDPASR